MMNPILLLVVKATLILLAGLCAAALASRARASVRHLILASTFAALLMLPLAGLMASPNVIELRVLEPEADPPGSLLRAASVMPAKAGTQAEAGPAAREREGRVSSVAPAEAGIQRNQGAGPAGARASAFEAAVGVWGAGFVLLLSLLAAALVRLRAVRRRGLPWVAGEALAEDLAQRRDVRPAPALTLHEDISAPMTYGVRRPLIVLPVDAESWDPGDLRRALVHEIEHVRRKDWAVQVVARGVCAAYWFHPLVWVAWRQLCLEGERACDDAVLQGTQATAGTDYAQQLVTLAQRLSTGEGGFVTSMANRSDLSVRVRAVLDGNQTRGSVGRAGVLAAAAAAGIVAMLVAPISVVAVERQAPAASPAASAKPSPVQKDEAVTRLAVARRQRAEAARLELERNRLLRQIEALEKRKAELEERIERGVAGGVEGGVPGGVEGGVAGGVAGGGDPAMLAEQSKLIEKLMQADRAKREDVVLSMKRKIEEASARDAREAVLKQKMLATEQTARIDADMRRKLERAAIAEREITQKAQEMDERELKRQLTLEKRERLKSRRGREEGEALIEAAQAGDIEYVRELLDGGFDVNTVVQGDGTALIGAARGRSAEMVEFLLSRGAKADLVVLGDGSPLTEAARKGSIEIVTLLLDRGADVNLGAPGDGNPLIMAAGAGHVDVVKLLLDRGADIEKVIPGDENALIHAAEGGSLEVVRLLLDRGANIHARVFAEHWRDGNEQGGEWRTPLSMARRNGHAAIVELLLSRGARDES